MPGDSPPFVPQTNPFNSFGTASVSVANQHTEVSSPSLIDSVGETVSEVGNAVAGAVEDAVSSVGDALSDLFGR